MTKFESVKGNSHQNKHLCNCLQRTQSNLLKEKGLAVQPLEMAMTNHDYARIFISHSLKKKKEEEALFSKYRVQIV